MIFGSWKRTSERYLIIFLVGLVGVVGWFPSPAAAAPSTEEIAEMALGSTLMIVSLDRRGKPFGHGSGFIIAPGVIATNAHVIEGAHTVAVRLVGQDRFIKVQELLAYDRNRDIAILQADRLKAPSMRLGRSGKLRVGQAVYAVGNPMGLEGTFSTGIVSAKRKARGLRYIQVTAPVSPGSSGGPILTARGDVVGVATMVVPPAIGGQNLNFAMPVEYVIDEARGAGVRLAGVSSSQPQARKPRPKLGSGSAGSGAIAGWFNKKDNSGGPSHPSSQILLRGDSARMVFFWPWCAEYAKIPSSRREEFRSRDEAESAGYQQARTCSLPLN